MSKESIYFDYNASMPLRPEAFIAMQKYLTKVGSALSQHSLGREMYSILDQSRRQVSQYLDCKAQEVIFVSSASEANNTVVNTFKLLGGSVIASAIEHPCVLNVSDKTLQIPVDASGVIDLGILEDLLQEAQSQGPILISVMMVNNETGVIQPLEEVVTLAKSYNAYVHTDAVQGVGRLPVSFKDLGVDYMTVSSHKLGGPFGVGALIAREGAPMKPLIIGASQEMGMRAGTHNVPAIAGFAAALGKAVQDDWTEVSRLRDLLESEIRAFFPDVPIYGADGPRVANTSMIGMPGVSKETQVIAFDLEGFCVSAGSACSSGTTKPSHVVLAMTGDVAQASETIRVSLGQGAQEADILKFVECWKKLYQQTRARFQEAQCA